MSATIPADVLAKARQAIAAAHQADPAGKEAAYSDSVLAWVAQVQGNAAEPLLELAARCQHLERWAIPRDSHPRDRAGYLRWRRAVADRQGQRARELLLGAGVGSESTERVARLVAKRAGPSDPYSQLLEDAACLVFLDEQIEAFAQLHDEPKLIGIVQKTWPKMSARAQQVALGLHYAPAVQALLAKALGGQG